MNCTPSFEMVRKASHLLIDKRDVIEIDNALQFVSLDGSFSSTFQFATHNPTKRPCRSISLLLMFRPGDLQHVNLSC